MRIHLIFLCSIFLFASSANSQNTVEKSADDWSDQKSEVVIVGSKSEFVKYLKDSRTNEIEEKVIRLSRQMNRSIAEENRLKNDARKNKEVLRKLNEQIADLSKLVMIIKNQVEEANEGYDKQIKQLLIELNQTKEQFDGLKNEVDKINKVLSELNKNHNITLEKTVAQNKPQLCKDPLDEYYKTEDPDYTWIIDKSQWRVESEVFPLKEYPYGAQLRLTLRDYENLIELSYKDINNTDQPLHFKVTPAVIYTYKNQTKPPPSSIIIPNFQEFGSKLEYDAFNYQTMVLDGLKVTNEGILSKEISDTLVIAVHVEPLRLAQYSCSYDGTLTWVVYKYWKIPENNVTVMNYDSPNFYTSPTGFRLHVSVYDVGEEGEMKLVAKVAILSGPNDDSLSRYSSFNITITFLHPFDLTKNVVRKESKSIYDVMNSIMYLNTGEELDSMWVDNTLYYNVKVIAI